MENDCRGVALLRLMPNATGKTGEKHHTFIRYYVDCHSVVQCRFEAQQRYASTVSPIMNFQSLIEEIFNSQFSIFNFWGLVLVSVKRRNEVERPERRCLSRRRVCGAHSGTKRRSSSADAALTSLVLSGSSQKERTHLGQARKNEYDLTEKKNG